MKGLRIKATVLVVIAGVLTGGGSVWANFVFDAARAEDVPPSGKGVSFSHDGLRLYISTSALTGGYGDRDIWVVERESPNAPWGEPVNLGPNVNTGNMEGWPTISPDELELYFGRDDGATWYPMRSTRDSKEDPWGPAAEYTGVFPDDFSSDGLTKYTVAEWPAGYGGNDIWMATRATIDADWGEPVNLGPNVNNSGDQYGPSISSDGLALFFISIGTLRGRQLHVCVRSTKYGPWGPAVDVGPPVNGLWWVVFPEISPDGSTLYCNRGSGHGFTQVSIKPIVDFNGDGVADVEDVVILTDHWGTDDTLCDIGPMPWGDGIVDVQDLLVLAEYIEPPVKLPIAHWAFDETEGVIAYDSAGDSDAIVVGYPAWQPEGGMVAGALELDGVDDRVLVSPLPNFGGGPFSVLAWIKGGAPGQVVLSQLQGASWLGTHPPDGSLMTDLCSSSGTGTALFSDVVVTDGDWHRIGLVWDGTDRILYVDEQEVARDTQGELAMTDNGLMMGTGPDSAPGTFFSGLIDDARIYNRAVKP